MTPEEAKAIAGSYPEEINFIGGPYCGAILRPRIEMITCVHRLLEPTRFPITNDLPINFFPADENGIVLKGPYGYAWYQRNEQGLWVFIGYADVQGEEDVE